MNALTSSNDAALISAARSGSSEAFEALAKRYGTPLANFAYGYLRDRDEAHDVAQEALMRGYRFLCRVESDRSFRNWLFVIARNIAYDALRRRERLVFSAVSGDRVPAHTPGPEELFLREETRGAVRHALAALPRQYREPLELHYLSGLLYREIAGELDLPIGTVKTNIARAKERLRIALDDATLQRIA